MSLLTRRAERLVWRLAGRLGLPVDAGLPRSLTVLMAFHHPARMVHLPSQVRQMLRCRFVERLILLNDNPQVSLARTLRIRDPRLTVLDQPVSRGCGHRWVAASAFAPRHLLVVDDDVLLRPGQVARLFRALLAQPAVPHGIAGIRELGDGRTDMVVRADLPVDYLVEVYAVTAEHLDRFRRLRRSAEAHPDILPVVERAADFILVSRAGDGRARIHDLGRILRCETFAAPGIAVHRQTDFETGVWRVRQVIDAIVAQASRLPENHPDHA